MFSVSYSHHNTYKSVHLFVQQNATDNVNSSVYSTMNNEDIVSADLKHSILIDIKLLY